MNPNFAYLPDFPGWFVTVEGEVMRPADADGTWRRAPKASPSDSGYARVTLDGKKVRVHRLVLFAFRGPPPTSRHHGAHLDGDKANNRLDNLAWKTPEENEGDKKAHGTAPKHGRTKEVSAKVRRKIRIAWDMGDSISTIARRHRLHRKTVARHAKAGR